MTRRRCIDCKLCIQAGRLSVFPDALRCSKCQQAAEVAQEQASSNSENREALLRARRRRPKSPRPSQCEVIVTTKGEEVDLDNGTAWKFPNCRLTLPKKGDKILVLDDEFLIKQVVKKVTENGYLLTRNYKKAVHAKKPAWRYLPKGGDTILVENDARQWVKNVVADIRFVARIIPEADEDEFDFIFEDIEA